MRQYTNFEMFAITKEYINKHHSDNPMDFVTNVYIFYFMSGRFPNASIFYGLMSFGERFIITVRII